MQGTLEFTHHIDVLVAKNDSNTISYNRRNITISVGIITWFPFFKAWLAYWSKTILKSVSDQLIAADLEQATCEWR